MRNVNLDNCKFLLILMVVFGHFLQSSVSGEFEKRILLFLYSFHMPAFVFLTGHFSKNAILEKKYYKAFDFLYLFIVIKIIRFFPQLIWKRKTTFSFVNIADVSWYAFAVFIFYILTFCVVRLQLSLKKLVFFSIIIACFCGYSIEVGTFYSLSRIITFYPFFLIGFCTNREWLMNITQKKIAKILAVFFLSFMVIFFFFGGKCIINQYDLYISLFKGKESYVVLGQYKVYGALLRLIWYFMAFTLQICFIIISPGRRCFFTNMGRRTVAVYAFHPFVKYLLLNISDFGAWLKELSTGYHLLAVVAISMAVVCLLSMPPFDWVIKRIIMTRERKSRDG